MGWIVHKKAFYTRLYTRLESGYETVAGDMKAAH